MRVYASSVRDPAPDPAAARARLCEALERVGAEDRAAFRVVYALTSAKLFGICLRICGDRGGAEDVLHDVYLTIWKRARQRGRGRDRARTMRKPACRLRQRGRCATKSPAHACRASRAAY